MAGIKYLLVFSTVLFQILVKSDSFKVLSVTAPKAPQYRLPNNTRPLHYNINLSTNIHKGQFDFSGTVAITLNVAEQNTAAISLNVKQLTIQKVQLLDRSLSNIYQDHRIENEILIIESSNILQFNHSYVLNIAYNGTLRDDNAGFYRSWYKNNKNETVWLASTQFESTDARHAFPCYDEPEIKADFEISILHGSNYTAQSNTRAIDQRLINDEYTLTTFNTTKKMSTYLIAFLVSDFTSTTSVENSRRYSVYSRPGTQNFQNFALETGIKALTSLEKYLGVDYELKKMYQAAIPDFAAGAMENWGLVTYREEDLLYNQNVSTFYTQIEVATTITHEFTHQWFGDLVTPMWWTYLWLNEGFATLYAYFGIDMFYTSWNVMDYFIVKEFQIGLAADQENSSHPMSSYIEKPDDIEGVFDSIEYSKAGSVLRMFQHALTDNTFKKGLKKYLEKNKFGAVTEDDLIQGLNEAAKEDKADLLSFKDFNLSKAFKSWSNQQGYPVLTLTRNDNGTVTITQEKFLIDGKTDNTIWVIPINFVSSNKNDFAKTTPDYVLTEKVTLIDLKNWNITKNDWILLNKQQTGFYRVNYDDNNWNLIISALEENSMKIHKYNRAQLVDDAFQLVISKRLKLDIFFNLLKYLAKETEYVVWNSASNILTKLNSIFYSDKDYGKFQYFLHILVRAHYKYYGWDKVFNNLETLTRNFILNLACQTGNLDGCPNDAHTKLNALMSGKTEISPDMQNAVYCNGLRNGGEAEYNFLINKLQSSSYQAERTVIATSLGCLQDNKLLEKFLSTSVDKTNPMKYRPHERVNILKYAYTADENGLSETINFLMKNAEEYAKILGSFDRVNPLLSALRDMTKVIVNEKQHKSFSDLLTNIGKIDSLKSILTTDELSSLQSSIDRNVGFSKESGANLLKLLNDYDHKNGMGAANSIVISSLAIFGCVLASLRTLF